MPKVIYWLLYLFLSGGSLEGPLGVYTEEALCIQDGEKLKVGVHREYQCEPVDEVVMKYLADQCLGNAPAMIRLLGLKCNNDTLQQIHLFQEKILQELSK